MKAIVRVPGGVEIADVKDPVPAGDEAVVERVGLETTPEALVRLRTPGHLVRVLTRPWD